MYNDEAFVGLEGFREWIQGRNESMLVCRCALTGRTVFAVDVWGDFACFTDPEGKTERISYPIPTHSALRGILSSVFCEPREFQWKILRSVVLRNQNTEATDSLFFGMSLGHLGALLGQMKTCKVPQAKPLPLLTLFTFGALGALE